MRRLAAALCVLAVLCAASPAPTAHADLAGAEELMGREKYAEAIAEFKKALETAPSDPRALYGISYCYIRLGLASTQSDELWSAEDYLKRLVEAAPGVAGYRYLRGWWAFTLAYRAPSYTRHLLITGEEELSAAYGLDRTNVETLKLLGLCREGLGKYKEAAEAYRAILEADPENLAYYPRLADCWYKAGMFKDAVGACRIGSAKDSANLFYLKMLGDALKAMGDLKSAEASYAAGIGKDPAGAQWYESLWLVLMDPASEGGAARCEEVFGALAEKHGRHVHPLKFHSVILRRNGKAGKALEVLKTWTSIDRGQGREWGWFWMGEVLAELGRPEEADAAFVAALEANPQFANAFNPLQKRFTAMRDGRRFSEAADLLKRISAANPMAEFHAWVMFELGADLQDMGDREGALKAWAKAEELNPTEPRFNNTLGLELRALGRIEEAMAQFRKAMEKSMDFMYSMENLGVTLLQIGKLADARDMLVRSYGAAEEQLILAPDPGTRAEREFDVFKFQYFLVELREIEMAGANGGRDGNR